MVSIGRGRRGLGGRLWGALRAGVARVGLGALGAMLAAAPTVACASGPAPELEPIAASGPARVVTGGAAQGSDMAAILADLEELEELAARGALVDGADAEVAGFRLDRLVADLTQMLADAEEGAASPGAYEVQVALGRAMALSSLRQRPGADELAIDLFANAVALEPTRAEAHLRLGRVQIERGDAAAALASFERANASADAVVYVEELGFYAALAAYEVGRFDEARALLKKASMQRPDSKRIARLQAILDATPDGAAAAGTARRKKEEGAISLGLEGRSLVQYEVKGATWLLVHETLGFRIGLPLSWQLSEEQIDEDSGGYVQIVAPPVTGANRQWRTETVTIWAVPIATGYDLESLTQAWLESVQDVGQLEELGTLARPGTRHLRLTRTPFMEDPQVGQALVMIEGSTGYVIECWGDAVSFLQIEPQLVEILRGFEPLGA